MKRIFDKDAKREVLADGAAANELQMLETLTPKFRSWNIRYTGREFTMPKPDSFELVEKGPVRSVIRIKRSFTGETKKRFYTSYFWITPACDYPSSFFEQDIILYHDSDRVDFKLRVDYWEDNLLLKTSFPLNVDAESASAEMPYSYYDRPTNPQTKIEKARFELYTLKWTDMSNDEYGVAMLNKNKHGYDVQGNTMRLTLLTSPYAGDDPHSVPDPLCDRGRHAIDYAIYPHQGNWRSAETVRRGWEYNAPLICRAVARHDGEWGSEKGWLEVDNANVVVASLKPALDGNGVILRAYESAGEKTAAKVSLVTDSKSAQSVNLIEKPVEEDGAATLDNWEFAPHQTRSLRIGN